jgi:hypothetical protein
MASRFNQALGLIDTMRRARLIAPMRPDRYPRIAVLDELPRGSTGKILRNQLQSTVGS